MTNKQRHTEWTHQIVRAERDRMQTALKEILELADNEADTEDGRDGEPKPNLAMRIATICDNALSGR